MEFRRIEVRKLLRYRELIAEKDEIKSILEQLQDNEMEFAVKMQGMGQRLERCVITSLEDDKVGLFSNFPSKIRLNPMFDEIEQLEVQSNCDFIAEQDDDGGRWSRLM